jgi:hypothetical protein
VQQKLLGEMGIYLHSEHMFLQILDLGEVTSVLAVLVGFQIMLYVVLEGKVEQAIQKMEKVQRLAQQAAAALVTQFMVMEGQQKSAQQLHQVLCLGAKVETLLLGEMVALEGLQASQEKMDLMAVGAADQAQGQPLLVEMVATDGAR